MTSTLFRCFSFAHIFKTYTWKYEQYKFRIRWIWKILFLPWSKRSWQHYLVWFGKHITYCAHMKPPVQLSMKLWNNQFDDVNSSKDGGIPRVVSDDQGADSFGGSCDPWLPTAVVWSSSGNVKLWWTPDRHHCSLWMMTSAAPSDTPSLDPPWQQVSPASDGHSHWSQSQKFQSLNCFLLPSWVLHFHYLKDSSVSWLFHSASRRTFCCSVGVRCSADCDTRPVSCMLVPGSDWPPLSWWCPSFQNASGFFHRSL